MYYIHTFEEELIWDMWLRSRAIDALVWYSFKKCETPMGLWPWRSDHFEQGTLCKYHKTMTIIRHI